MAYGNFYGSALPPYQTPYYQPQPMMNAQPMVDMQNFQPQAQPQTQPRPNQAEQTNQNSPIHTSVLWVNNPAEAQNAFVLANNTVLIMQNDMSKLYIKSADNIGRITLDEFDIHKAVPTPQVKIETPQVKKNEIDFDKFVTREELADLIPKNNDFVTHEELEEMFKPKKTTKKEG